MTAHKILEKLRLAAQSPEIVEAICKELHLTPQEVMKLSENAKALWLSLSPEEKKRLITKANQ